MAFPFKTGGDFYNCEAQRMRLHNLGANPTETATGLMYFNTGTSNLGKHAVVHDGTNFKALAFVDEIASNTAFTELANRVLTIEKALGEDTANVIDTWEEIQNFLKDIDDNDANLMTMLNDKLSLSQGGVMTGTIKVGNYDAFGQTGGNFYIGTPDYPLLLRSNGTTTINGNTLIHSGNYNTYAPKLDGTGAAGTWGISISGNATSATKLQTKRKIWGQDFDGTGNVSGALSGVTDIKAIGHANVKNLKTTYIYIECDNEGNINGFSSEINDFRENLYIQHHSSNHCIICAGGGVVGIGTSLPQYKLDVAGTARFTDAVTMESTLTVAQRVTSSLFATSRDYGLWKGSEYSGAYTEKDIVLYASTIGIEGIIRPLSNNIYSLGTSSNQWSHLYAVGATLSGAVTIKGDLVVEGNIIGKKEVSAGGAGQEGESGAGGGAEVISQTLASGASSYTITNTIKRSDIAVSLYEWNASGNSWDMCLADISVTNSNIIVTFGSATTVDHKIVAVG